MRAACALGLLLLAGCRISFSPLQNRIAFGEGTYVVFTARGEGGADDLYAVRGEGGEVWPVTYTRVDERLPALSPDGKRLGFVRQTGHGHDRVVVLDLVRGSEDVLHESPTPGRVVAGLAWAGDTVRALVSGGVLRGTADRGALEPAPADTAGFAVALGRPVFATVVPCAGEGICVRTLSGEVAPLDVEGRDAAAWGADSVGYFVGEEFLVRPLGAGRARTLRWHPVPERAGGPTAFVAGGG